MVEPSAEVNRTTDLMRLSDAAAPLAPQQLAMTILGGHARDGRLVWSGGLVNTLKAFGFEPGAARVALGRLVRSGVLTRIRDGRLIHYRLTDAGEKLMLEGDRRIFTFGRDLRPADVWTVVWHTIPEHQGPTRSRLTRRLRFFGFGQLQDSTWVAPHDLQNVIDELLTDLGVSGHSIVMVGRPTKPGGVDALVRQCWDLDRLADHYQRFDVAVSPFLEPPRTDLESFVVRNLMVHLFRQFPFRDPELPNDPVGIAALRTEALTTFHELFSTLREPAQRHFEAASAAPTTTSKRRAGSVRNSV